MTCIRERSTGYAGRPGLSEKEFGMKYTYAVVFEKAPNNYCAYVPELGCASTAKTRDEIIEIAREGMEVHIELMLENGDPIPEPRMSVRDAMEYHIALCDEEIEPEPGVVFEDYEETETSFIMVEVEVEPARSVALAEPAVAARV